MAEMHEPVSECVSGLYLLWRHLCGPLLTTRVAAATGLADLCLPLQACPQSYVFVWVCVSVLSVYANMLRWDAL